MNRLLALAACLLLVAGCDPQVGPSAGSGANRPNLPPRDGNDDFVDPCEGFEIDASFLFALSDDPNSHESVSGEPVAGALTLYLWLVESTGLAAVEFDFELVGATLRETYFTPAGDNLFITWEGSGDVDLAVAECPTGPVLLGEIHLWADGTPLSVDIVRGSEESGAVHCGDCPMVHDFESIGYVATGGIEE